MATGPSDFVVVLGRYGDGDDFLRIEERIGRVREHARQLARAGIPFYAPHLNSAHFDRIAPDVPREFWLRQGRVFLDLAWGAYVVTHEWWHSTGTNAEVAYLNRRERPVYYTENFDALVEHWRKEHPR